MFTKISVAALLAGLAAAVHAPVGEPKGNAITRPLNEVIPAGKPFTITWEPTTTNKVSLLLLKGPSTNVVPIETLADGIANSGSFTFTPSTSLEGTTGNTGYGLQLIDDVTGQYQYSTQFGVSVSEKPADKPASSAAAGYPVASSAAPSVAPVTPVASSYPVGTAPAAVNSTLATICSTTTSYVAPVGTAAPSGSGSNNYTVIQPSKPLSVPASLAPSGTATPPAQSTGGAAGLKAGLGLAGAVAGLVFML